MKGESDSVHSSTTGRGKTQEMDKDFCNGEITAVVSPDQQRSDQDVDELAVAVVNRVVLVGLHQMDSFSASARKMYAEV